MGSIPEPTLKRLSGLVEASALLGSASYNRSDLLQHFQVDVLC